jgi:hypothetical protein
MIDALGYAASLAVLATFPMRSMLPLRVVAIASNILFLTYGYLAHIPPVLFLHAMLLPINIVRLLALRGHGTAAPVADRLRTRRAPTGLASLARSMKFMNAGQRSFLEDAAPQNEDSLRLRP